MPGFTRQSLDRLDAFWQRGRRDVPVEELLQTSLLEEATAVARPDPPKPSDPATPYLIGGGVVLAAVVAGVVITTTRKKARG